MHEGEFLKQYIDNKPIQVTKVVQLTGIKRATIYTHYKKQKLDSILKTVYSDKIGIIWDNNGLTLRQTNPRLEAEPIHLAADPNDFDNDGSKFEELADGTIRMRIPVIPHKAFAGYLRGFQDAEYFEDFSYTSIEVFKKHQGHYLAFEVRGDSMTTMEPEFFRQSIFDGVKVVGRFLPRQQWAYKLHTHSYEAWVIVHKTEGILIKNIIKHDVEKGIITIHSLNPDKVSYPDEELFLDDIEQIFNVVKKIDE